MKLDITGRHITVSDGLREHTEERLEKIDKLFDEAIDAHVVLFVEKHRHVAEIQIKSRAGVFSGQESTGDLYISINEAVEKIEKQIRRFKDKRTDRRRREGTTAAEAVAVFTSENQPEGSASGQDQAGDDTGRIVHSDRFRKKPLSPEDAVMVLVNSGEDILVYRDAETDRFNVVHRLPDGNFGVVDPEF
ncbi:MAG: ribosome-associated translation inhibitor RaiA [Acidobacteria bacterium]|uniref:Ribosome hibernation promoting factor n=1 Tax=Candidatus Polarisedimenticola svalbardensis TaxID=2886004 RepID=A0A8J6XQL9_9BACT|nr:ribosome-associated translation inhibitor RaiA [Candidatus Polarisedimenticola svalbardensis]